MLSIQRSFHQTFGHAPDVIARAPGRVEFIGNHTDYNGGAVLGVAINRGVVVAAAPAAGGSFRVRSNSGVPALEFTGSPPRRLEGADSWANYVFGVWHSLADFSLPQPAGFDLLVDSDLPSGAGLSSSAALELATAQALLVVAGAPALPPDQLATLGRHAENRYVGVPCGILDQGTSAFGAAGQIVHIDCRGPLFARVPLPGSAHLWIFNTHEKHALIDGLYATRHRECEEVEKLLDISWLTDLTPSLLESLKGKLPPVLARRAKHIVEEHARVAAVIQALENGSLAETGRLLTASHRSSQHLFENSTPALDALVDALEKHPAVYGARLTGGGFGGAVMALAHEKFTEAEARIIAETAHPGTEVLHLQSAEGAQVLWQRGN
jgi:galactokinase